MRIDVTFEILGENYDELDFRDALEMARFDIEEELDVQVNIVGWEAED